MTLDLERFDALASDCSAPLIAWDVDILVSMATLADVAAAA
jgi:hypothetical protein